MGRLRRTFILGLLFGLTCLSLPQAQTGNKGVSDSNAPAASSTSTGQAPEDITAKITQLVHAGKYTEAQQLTTGLLAVYPHDERLIKAKALIEKLLAPASSTSVVSDNTKPPQPLANTSTEPLTGMERVDYNALIVLAHQAQQTSDLPEQTKLLQRFMDQSSPFLQRHPMQMLLWQLRAASAISLNEPMAGYESGEKLLAAGAADSTDSNLQGLLAQLKNQGWLEKEWAETIKKQMELTKQYGWMLGTWSETFTSTWKRDTGTRRYSELYKTGSTKYELSEEFHLSKSSAAIEAYDVKAGVKSAEPLYRGTLVNSGEMRWEGLDVWNERHIGGHSGSEQWEQATSSEIDEHKKTMTLVFLSWNDQKNKSASQPQIHLFTKSDSNTQ